MPENIFHPRRHHEGVSHVNNVSGIPRFHPEKPFVCKGFAGRSFLTLKI
jgi:hypothetical protein